MRYNQPWIDHPVKLRTVMNHDILKWARHFSRANKTLTAIFFTLTYYRWYYPYIFADFIVLQLQSDSPDMLRWIRLRLRKSMGHSQLGRRIWSSVGRCWEKAGAPFEPKLCPYNLFCRCRMPRTACQAGTFHLMNVNKVYSFACFNIDLAMAKTSRNYFTIKFEFLVGIFVNGLF